MLLATLLSTTLYLLPVAALQVMRARRDRELWEIALDLPLAVALDMLIVLALSRVMTLETAVLASRPAWLLWVGDGLVRRWRSNSAPTEGSRWARVCQRLELSWPASLTWRALVVGGLAAWMAVEISSYFSDICHSFDRAWHIPLASSIRGQRLPFANVYEPGEPLAYHFSGDALAAMLQVLSGARLHISRCLSLAHDIMFGLSAASAGLFAMWLGIRRIVPAAVAGLTPLLCGPLLLLLPDGRRAAGHNFPNFLKLSFRPHVSLAALMLIALGAIILVRLRKKDDAPPLDRTAWVLVACTALLSVTDEASTGVFGVALGLTWLAVPQVLHERRLPGLLLLVSLLVALIGANVLYNGALVAGEVGGEVAWVPMRAPGYYRPPLAIDDPKAVETLTWDLLPMATLWFAGMLTLLRHRNREQVGAALFATAVWSLSVLLLVHIDMGQRSLEAHRFVTAAMVLLPLLGVWWLTAGRGKTEGDSGLAHTLIVGTMAVTAVCAGDWLRRAAQPKAKSCATSDKYFAEVELFDVDCRALAGASLGQRPRVTYVEKHLTYVYAGCNTLYGSGPPPKILNSDRLDLEVRGKVPQWHARIGRMLTGQAALANLHHDVLAPDDPLVVICGPEGRGTKDVVCRMAVLNGSCQPLTPIMRRCVLSGAEREKRMGVKRPRPKIKIPPPKPAKPRGPKKRTKP